MSQTHVAHTKPWVECKVCQSHAGGSKVKKHSFSNSAKLYYSHLADSVLEPSLIKSALVHQYLYKKYFRANTNIQESMYSHDNNIGYVGPDVRSWQDSCLPGLGSWGIFFFYFCTPPPPITFLMVHPSDIYSLWHRALWNQQRSKPRHEHRFRIVKQLPLRIAPQKIQE